MVSTTSRANFTGYFLGLQTDVYTPSVLNSAGVSILMRQVTGFASTVWKHELGDVLSCRGTSGHRYPFFPLPLHQPPSHEFPHQGMVAPKLRPFRHVVAVVAHPQGLCIGLGCSNRHVYITRRPEAIIQKPRCRDAPREEGLEHPLKADVVVQQGASRLFHHPCRLKQVREHHDKYRPCQGRMLQVVHYVRSRHESACL